jgi:hypothetical protein
LIEAQRLTVPDSVLRDDGISKAPRRVTAVDDPMDAGLIAPDFIGDLLLCEVGV